MYLVERTKVGFVMEGMNVLAFVRKIGRQVSSGESTTFGQELPQIFPRLPRAEHGLQSGPASQPSQAHLLLVCLVRSRLTLKISYGDVADY